MKETSIKMLKALSLVNFFCCIMLYVFVNATGFESGRMTWGYLTPITFFLGYTAYNLMLIVKEEVGDTDIKKFKLIALIIFILFLILPLSVDFSRILSFLK